MTQVDRKYTGVIMKADGTIVDDWIIFRAQDKAVLQMLAHYAGVCIEKGCSKKHTDGIINLIKRVRAWQESNPDRMKLPDTSEEDLIINALDLGKE